MKGGIDVSRYQGNIDFELVSKHIDFAIIRLGYTAYGAVQKDVKFDANYAGFRKAGIPVGVYVYSYDTSMRESLLSAQSTINLLKGLSIDYPVWYDFEEANRAFSNLKQENTEIAAKFMATVRAAGYETGLYTSTSFFKTAFVPSPLSEYDLWIADWTGKAVDVGREYQMHQYSNKGRIEGITVDVDLNRCYKDYVPAREEAPVTDLHALVERVVRLENLLNDIKEVLCK